MSAFRVYGATPPISPETEILLLIDRSRARTVYGVASRCPRLRDVAERIAALVRSGWLVQAGDRLSVVRLQSCPHAHRLELLQLRRLNQKESNHVR